MGLFYDLKFTRESVNGYAFASSKNLQSLCVSAPLR